MSIPGYAGYRPKVTADNHIGHTVTEQSRQVFQTPKIDQPENTFSSTGFNAKLIPQYDATREARSRRFGVETKHFPHPTHHPNNHADTIQRLSYKSPYCSPKPNFRERNPSQLFTDAASLSFKKVATNHCAPTRTTQEDTHFKKESLKQLASGYTINRQNWDGSGWGTEANAHTDQMRTSYRKGFATPKPFHKTTLRNNDGRINRK